jgi:xanthine dehydrogenase YagT iron-sulfur-binding subunit
LIWFVRDRARREQRADHAQSERRDPRDSPRTRGAAIAFARAMAKSNPGVERAREAKRATKPPGGTGGDGILTAKLVVNGKPASLDLDPRTTLLDALREHLHLTGTKKGCDHGQCGACTVLVDGRRINSCLTLAVMHEGEEIVTIEGLGSPDAMHPMQAAFVKHDAFQCGYCTPGQICSAIAVLSEARAGWPSHATKDVGARDIELTDDELRERMSGNVCRCCAYPNIIAAIRDAANGGGS